jgi:hypothetical protein
MKIQRSQLYIIFFLLLIFSEVNIFGQETNDYEDLLQRVDTIENPVYKPVISIGYGALNFVGDVKSSFRSPVIGDPGFKFNISTFIDNNHYFAANFYFLTGTLTGNQRSYQEISKNLNFSSSIYSIGASVQYNFGQLISEDIKFRPYLSIGVEQFNFNTKGDLKDSDGQDYYYWPDGTIRNLPEDGIGGAKPLSRDYVYETDLRSYEREIPNTEFGEYSLRSIGIPLGIGFSMDISERIAISVGTEYHFTFTDYIDNVSSSGTRNPGNRQKDGFFFTVATLHFDMFSQPKTKTVDLLFAELDLDPVFFNDEDGDFILDHVDRCPGTPYGVITDTLGCPFDNDNDGVPNYKDKEKETPPGNWVDDNGVSMSEDEFLAKLKRESALKREDLESYLAIFRDKYKLKSATVIPEKFITIDQNEDGYISFDELLKMIDSYFDFTIDLSLEELRQVNEFFFSQ